ncbi:MAG: AMP-binding protein, partial [Pseudomonadota bacterium]|nr:AMP-binding protein [Pseudomonadota bacterium]
APVAQGTVVDLLFAAARDRPHAIALICGEDRLDYAGYAAAVRALAHKLHAASHAAGRIATLLPNSLDACIAHFAVLAAGRQLAPLNPGHMPRELDFELRDARPDMLLADTTLRAALMPTILELGMTVLWVGSGEMRFADAASAVDACAAPLPELDPASLALLQYTGGTSGRPKGVDLTHASLRVNVAQREAMLPTRADGERILCAMPLFHSYGMAMGLYLAVHCRGTLVILPDYRREALFDAVERHAITVFPGSPTLYAGLLDHPRFESVDWSSVRTCYSGAAALPVALMERWRSAVGVSIYEGYGQTEAGPVLSYNSPFAPVKSGSVGRPLPGTLIEIVDVETGSRVLATGSAGEIRARGPQLMQGYRNRPEETAEALRNGWLYTGDIGEFDADGYLFIRDRKKDMVIVSGYNVYPREIEEVLQAHPAVLEAAVIGEPDSYRGEVLHAFVVLRSDTHLDNAIDELQAYCAGQLVRYKRPARLTLVGRLPKTSVNKTDKKALRSAPPGTAVAAHP